MGASVAAVQLSAEAIQAALAAAPVARLATLTKEGLPRLVPIVYVRSGDDFWSPVDGKPKEATHLARLRDVERDPRVGLLVDAYEPDWRRLWWIRIVGRAEVVRSQGGRPPNAFASAAAALRAKYPQYAETDLFVGDPTLLRIRAETTSSWAATPEAAARILAGEIR